MTNPPSPAQCVMVEGSDAEAFLQAQLSSNVAALTPGSWHFSSWLDAQGRVRALLHLARLDERKFLLILRGADATALSHELGRYIFRSKLTITPSLNHWLIDDSALPLHSVGNVNDQVSLGCGTHSVTLSSTPPQEPPQWPLWHIQLGWPWLPISLQGSLQAPSLSLMRLQAAALDKGCYPGQELVARLHYRGGNKRHLYTVKLSAGIADASLLKTEDDIAVQLLHVVQGSVDIEALAIIAIDATHKLTNVRITSHDITLSTEQRWDA